MKDLVYLNDIHIVDASGVFILLNKQIGSWCLVSREEKKLVERLSKGPLPLDIVQKEDSTSGEPLPLFRRLLVSGIININDVCFLKDEYIEDESQPFTIVVKTTDRCNLKCGYCYTEYTKISHESFSTEALVGSLRRIREILGPRRKILVVFHGGEPLLFFDEIKRAILSINSSFENVDFSIQTNGTLLTPETVSFLQDNSARLGLSIDGHLFDMNRNRFKSEQTFLKVLDNIDLLSKSKVTFGLLSVVNASNAPFMKESLRWFIDRGVRSFVLNPMISRKGNYSSAFLDLLADSYISVIRFIDDWNSKHTDKAQLINERSCSAMIHTLLLQDHGQCYSIPCGAGYNCLALDTDNTPYLCDLFMGDPAFRITELSSIKTMGEEETIKAFINSTYINRKDECQDCPFDKICLFRCPADSYYIHGDFCHRHSLCELTKRLIPRIMKLLSSKEINPSNFIALQV